MPAQRDLYNLFIDFFKKKDLHHAHHRFLLAVSGGVDSVVLCELSKLAGLNFSIAHCNFKLREEESFRDEQFVRQLAGNYSAGVFVKEFDTALFAKENQVSVQEAARLLRYQWFDALREKEGFSFTLLAHHANDNIETLLMNFFRGTGLEGLTGMEEHSAYSNCLRPLLGATREEIEKFARERNLEWVEDSSNASSKYTRNFFRNELLPQIKTVYPAVEENLLDTLVRLQKTKRLYQELVQGFKKKFYRCENNEARIPVKALMQYADTSLIYEIIKDFGFGEKQVGALIKLAESSSGRYIENDTNRIIKHGRWFIVTAKKAPGATVAINEMENQVRFEGGILHLETKTVANFKMKMDSSVAQLDSKAIKFPMVLRRWKAGDYFYPLGLRKKKKVARFLIDQKLPRHQKENTWVVESDKKIVWVVGLRIDDRFKITDKTKNVLLLAHEP